MACRALPAIRYMGQTFSGLLWWEVECHGPANRLGFFSFAQDTMRHTSALYHLGADPDVIMASRCDITTSVPLSHAPQLAVRLESYCLKAIGCQMLLVKVMLPLYVG